MPPEWTLIDLKISTPGTQQLQPIPLVRIPAPPTGTVKQVYYAEILPDAFDLWKNYRNASQREAACRIRAGYLRHLARTGRFPSWAAGMMPPPGLVTTVDASLKIVAHRKLQAVSSLNLVASILEDKAFAHRTNVDTYKEGLRRQYAQYTPPPGSTISYNYQVALELAGRLVEWESHELNKKLNQESDELKQSPEAILWSGIPNSLRPKNLSNPPTRQNNLPNVNDALYSDVVQLNVNRQPGDLNQVSPLTIAEQARTANQGNQIFQASWAPTGPQRSNRGNGRCRPYNQQMQRQPNPVQDQAQFPNQQRRHPRREGQNQFQQNRGNDIIGALKQLIDRF